jgi:hypothetical protein
MMLKSRRVRQLSVFAVAVTLSLHVGAHAMAQAPSAQTTPAKSEPVKGVAIVGCLTGTKLTQIEPPEGAPGLPDTLRVTTIRVIRDQLKPLNGHRVELIGALRNIPDQEKGILVSDSDKAKVYVGGGDKNLGSDLAVSHNDPPTIHASTIRDLAPSCANKQSK